MAMVTHRLGVRLFVACFLALLAPVFADQAVHADQDEAPAQVQAVQNEVEADTVVAPPPVAGAEESGELGSETSKAGTPELESEKSKAGTSGQR